MFSGTGSRPKYDLEIDELKETIKAKWPECNASITLSADRVYSEDPSDIIGQIGRWTAYIQQTVSPDIPRRDDIILREICDSMTRAIFGSNQIERAGLKFDLTMHICAIILAGEDADLAELDIYTKQPDLEGQSAQHIRRSYHEVAQHARAFLHLLHAFVVNQRDLSEDLIKETHRILVTGVPLIEKGFEDVQPEEYGGIYRDVIVGAGTTNFAVPKFVPLQMAKMCDDLKTQLDKAEMEKTIDPFSVASKYSLEFVQIHPFRDGNGRMCRMVLNAILCRYLGIIVPIGEVERDREAYMSIKRRASQNMEGHGEYAAFVLQKGKTRVRVMKKKLMGKQKWLTTDSGDNSKANSPSTTILDVREGRGRVG